MIRKMANAIVIVLCATLLSSASPYIAPNPIASKGASDTNAAGKPTAPLPVAVNVFSAPKSKAEAAEDKADRNEKAEADWWIIHLTGLLAIIGAVQTIAFALQARRLKQTIVKMDETAEIQLRAYVSFGAGRISMHPQSGAINCEIKVQNKGQTPAVDIAICVHSIIAEYPLRTELPPLQFGTGSRPVLAQEESFMMYDNSPAPTQSEKQGLAGKTSAVYLYGEVHYTDVFFKRRVTKARFYKQDLSTPVFHSDSTGNEIA